MDWSDLASVRKRWSVVIWHVMLQNHFFVSVDIDGNVCCNNEKVILSICKGIKCDRLTPCQPTEQCQFTLVIYTNSFFFCEMDISNGQSMIARYYRTVQIVQVGMHLSPS